MAAATDATEGEGAGPRGAGGEGEAGPPAMPITLFRGGQVLQAVVTLGQEGSMGTDRIVHWCGAQLQVRGGGGGGVGGAQGGQGCAGEGSVCGG